ncbi:GNAT family N-acetyltransferase [Roseateles sp.]|uniref:GNAT family N-acetyltransferase n=1 Tax=Roseateles sp. TaxID=1971397 RepID=UPI003BA50B6B
MTAIFKTIVACAKRLTAPLREFGFGLGVLYLLDRSLRALSSAWGIYPYAFVVQPIPEKPLLPPMMSKHGRAERLTPSSPWLSEAPLASSVFAERLARGDCGVVALRKEQLLGYAWWSAKGYFEQEVRCTFEVEDAARAVFDFDVYVRPEHRMGLGFIAVWDALSEELRQGRVELTYSRISRFNLASLRAHSRFGAKEVGRVVFMRAGGLTLAVSAQFPFLRIGMGDGLQLRLSLGKAGLTWLTSRGRS